VDILEEPVIEGFLHDHEPNGNASESSFRKNSKDSEIINFFFYMQEASFRWNCDNEASNLTSDTLLCLVITSPRGFDVKMALLQFRLDSLVNNSLARLHQLLRNASSFPPVSDDGFKTMFPEITKIKKSKGSDF